MAKRNVSGLISRSAWGARYPDGFEDRPLPVTEFWLHHSVTIAPDLLPPFDDDDEAVRKLESIGQSRFGGGISYTMPVTPIGRIYVGHSFWRKGAHTYRHNTIAAAFCLVGNYETSNVTSAQIEAIASAMVRAQREGLATRHTLNGGHRDASGNSTSCPGAKGEAAIKVINARAEVLWASGYPNEVVVEEEDDMYTEEDRERDRYISAQVRSVEQNAYDRNVLVMAELTSMKATIAGIQAGLDMDAIQAGAREAVDQFLESLRISREEAGS